MRVYRYLAGYSIISEYAPLAIVVVSTTCILKEVLARYVLRLYSVSGSLLCKADVWHRRVDALTGIAVAPVFVFSMLNNINSILFDLAATAVIAVLIMKEGFEISKEVALSPIDMVRHDIIDRVTQVTDRVKDVVEVHDVRVRNYGGYYYIEMKHSHRPNKNH